MKLAEYALAPLARKKVTIHRRTRAGKVETLKLEIELLTSGQVDEVRVEATQYVDAYDKDKAIVDRETAIRNMETVCLLSKALKDPAAKKGGDDTWAGPSTLKAKLDDRTLNLLEDVYLEHLRSTITVIAESGVADAIAVGVPIDEDPDGNVDGVEIPFE